MNRKREKKKEGEINREKKKERKKISTETSAVGR